MVDLDFRPPGLEMRAAFEEIVWREKISSCQFAFAALFSLQDKYGTEVCIIEGRLFLRSRRRTPGRVDYFAPLCAAEHFAESVAAVEASAADEGLPYALFGLTEQNVEALRRIAPGRYLIEEQRDWAEYIYDTRSLATLEGSALKQKRKDARICRKTYGERLTTEPLTAQNAADAWVFQQEWYAYHQNGGEAGEQLAAEHRAIRCALTHYTALGLTGVLLRLEGRVVGYSYGCPVGGQTYDILVQKAAPDVKYLYRVVFQETVRQCAMDCAYVNAEEDIGLEGLRKLKLSYHPLLLLRKFNAVPGEEL